MYDDESYRRAEGFLPWRAVDAISGTAGPVRWAEDSSLAWHRVTTGPGRRYIAVDPTTGDRRPAFDHDRLVAAMDGGQAQILHRTRELLVFEQVVEYDVIMNSGVVDTAPPVELALASALAGMAELITSTVQGGLDHHDDAGLLELIDRSAMMRNQLQAFDAELLAVCRDRELAERECQRSMTKVLERRCLVSPQEALRRIQAADATGPRQSPTGAPLGRLRPAVQVAMADGVINAEQASIVCQTLGKLDRAGVHPEQVAAVEAEFVAHCRQFGPKELRQIGQRYVDAYDPDGPEPDEQRNWDRRSWRMRQTASGAVVGEFRLTPETAAKAQVIINSLSHPRLDTAAGSAVKDLRSHEQRQHDAFGDMCSRLLRVGGLPDSGGTPTTVIVTIDQADLLADLTGAGVMPEPAAPTADRVRPGRVRRSSRGRGITSDGISLSVPQLLDLAGEAEIYPVVLTEHGILLEMGRSRRIANKNQTLALIARDGGCSFPGCDRPPEWCERHHVISWRDNGKTGLKNLTLLCAYHHRHFLNRGWQVRINPSGLPEWLPPRYLDPDQKPVINNRIIARIHQSPLIT